MTCLQPILHRLLTSNLAGAMALFSVLWLVDGPMAKGQVCDGVLGDPVLNQTFGASSRNPLPPEQITYSYTTGNCPDDGQYTIADSVSGKCFGSVWHQVTTDHTPGDDKGNMLIVNATFGSDALFYVQPLAGLCSGTKYEFSVWVLNLYNPRSTKGCGSLTPRDPVITMRVETASGKLIQMVSTGTIPRTDTPTWVKCTMMYTVPPNTDNVLIKLINNGLGGCGNDLAMDDIQVRPCRPDVKINFAGKSGSITSLCDGKELSLNSTLSSTYAGEAYQWQESLDSLAWRDLTDATGPEQVIQGTGKGKRYYRLQYSPAATSTGSQCNQYKAFSNVLVINSVSPVPFRIPADTVLCQGSEFSIAIPTGQPTDIQFVWSDGSSDKIKVINQAGLYWLESDWMGCTHRDSITVSVEDCATPQVYVPTAFSPNNDGINDVLAVFAEKIEDFEMKVYDRWGSVIFFSNSISQRWDGAYQQQLCAPGQYTWFIKYKVQGFNNPEAKIEKSGHVLLIR